MRVLEFGDLDKLAKKHPGVPVVSGMPTASLTGPSILVNPKPEARK